jgi:hypothetical protein
MLQPIPGFIGGTGFNSFPDRDAAQLVNFTVDVAAPAENPTKPTALIGTPGLKPYVAFTDAWGTGAYACATANFTLASGSTGTDRTFFVSSQTPTSATGGHSHLIEPIGFSELTQTGVYNDKGQLPTFSTAFAPWKIVPSSTQLLIIGNGNGAIFTPGTEAITNISFGFNFPGAIDATWLDDYFAVIPAYSQKFFISGFADGTSWDPLDYGLEDTEPGPLTAIKAYRHELWVFGTLHTEVWSNTGNANFPFQRNNSASLRIGCTSAQTLQQVGDSLIWMGRDDSGFTSIYQARGYTAARLSTNAIDKVLQDANTAGSLETATSMAFRWNGMDFYSITIPTKNVTFLYNVNAGVWSTWSVGVDPVNGTYPMHQATCATYNRTLARTFVGTRDNNSLYSLDNRADDYGHTIYRVRSLPVMEGNGKRQFFSKFLIEGTPTANYSLQWCDAFASVAPTSGQQTAGIWYTAVPYSANPGANLAGNRIMWTRLGSSYNGDSGRLLSMTERLRLR